MNQFVHICKCVLYSIHFVYKGLIHKWKCILHVHGPRNKRSAITGGCCYLKLKYHKIYNSTMKIADSGNHLINIFKVSFVIRAYHIYAINSKIGSPDEKQMTFCSRIMSWTKFYVMSQCLQVIQEKSHWPPWPLWQRPWIILEQDLRPSHYYILL